ncbi:MAG TPA: hypothetical protein VGR95_16410 [Thermoanaerobaculia bacterium]|jgi:hypothetical protein|nr:hypothetical protein [Thermoanaerobaculia bacterium]
MRYNEIVFAVLLLLTAVAHAQPNASNASPRVEYLTDASGVEIGLTVHVGELPLTIRAGLHNASAGPLSVLKKRDTAGREITFVLSDGSTAGSFSVAKSGRIESLELKNGMKLALTPARDGLYKETLSVGHGSRVIHEQVTSTGTRFQPSDIALDMVSKTLNLAEAGDVTTKRDASGTLTTVTNSTGEVVLYIVRYGTDKAAFDVSGNLLFLDLFADMYRRPASETENWVDIQPLVPDHIVVTADGRIGAYVSTPAPGAIRAVWDERDDAGKTTYEFRLASALPSN